ncbi:MAG: acetate--CoA ligase family protein [Pseudomonadota bacterium]
MQGIHETLNAIRDAAWWHAAQKRILADPPRPMIAATPPRGPRVLNEAMGKERLADAGFPVPAGRLVAGDRLCEAAGEIGFPLALKMMGPELAHKTDAGAVALGIETPDALIQEVEAMRRSVAQFSKTAVTETFLVEPMAPKPLVELVVGVRRDAQFGLAMTLGSGGVLVELVGDACTVLLPATGDDFRRALAGLRVARMLDGFRGGPKADTGAVVSALTGLAEYAIAQAKTVVEIEINPLFVYEQGVLAVDVLMQVDPD